MLPRISRENRKKYRATVFSLFVSVVLFISATSFCDYMSTAINTMISTVSCDIRVGDDLTDDSKALYDKLRVTKGVTKSSYYFNLSDRIINISRCAGFEHF